MPYRGCRSPHPSGAVFARASPTDRHPCWLRHVAMRRLRRASRRYRGQVLHHARGAGRRARGHDDRRAGRRWRHLASDAGRVPRTSWFAVRLLHARHDHDGGRHGAPQGQRARRTHDPARARRQSLPLHRLPQHRESHRRRRQGHGGPISHKRHREGRGSSIRETRMYAFKYHRPTTVRQAANLLAKNEDAKLLAGGHTLMPTMKQRLAARHISSISADRRTQRHRIERPFDRYRRDREPHRGANSPSSVSTCRRWPILPA